MTFCSAYRVPWVCAVAEVESTLSNDAVGCEHEAWHELLEGGNRGSRVPARSHGDVPGKRRGTQYSRALLPGQSHKLRLHMDLCSNEDEFPH